MTESNIDLRDYSPTALAFMGDAVYELLSREYVIAQGSRPAGELHRLAVRLVSAHAQASASPALLAALTPEEADVYRRGRNSHSVRPPRNADPGEYRRATGIEALFGWLYLRGETARIREIFEIICRACGGTTITRKEE